MNSEHYERLKHGEVSNFDESNKFFKRAGKQRADDKPFANEQPSPPLPEAFRAHAVPAPPPSSLQKTMLEDQQFRFLPGNTKEAEGTDGFATLWPPNEAQLPGSPDYNKNEESFERSAGLGKEQSDAPDHEIIDKTEFSKEARNADLGSPKSLFVYLSNGLRQNPLPKQGPEPLEQASPGRTGRTANWEGPLDDVRRGHFRLNLINIDDNIMVPETSGLRETGGRGGLFGSMASEKSKRMDTQ